MFPPNMLEIKLLCQAVFLVILVTFSCASPAKGICKTEGHPQVGCVQLEDPLTLSKASTFNVSEVLDAPTSIDWRIRGAVTGIKNQGDCGCCWAFSVVAAVEGLHKIKTGKLVKLSVQELVDCDKATNGCCGSARSKAFQYITDRKGLTSDDIYKYTAKQGSCLSDGKERVAVEIHGYERVPTKPNSEQNLLKAVANQPVSAVVAVQESFRKYNGGIFKGPCVVKFPLASNEWHAITVIGYGTSEDGTKYWLIKNSWGEHWGEKGYMRMKMGGDGSRWGLCGIAMQAFYPTV